MSAPTSRPRPLAHAPVVLRDGQWWLVGRAGSIPASDSAFTTVLDDFAQAMAAADRAVACLVIRQSGSSAPDPGDRR
ncbi:hypothetical protein OG978_12605 [Streptomyces sp. NBC_01591]|uniref:hypothetical protein n=1 Tax=Streptomyces sp. NBC_01591 TaxID=2975888 RepID=UPI002DDA3FA7|nr:hypothetical protein [Streptomyces sp. NBC_01591]WSD68170.1 hypothetical protein OG978_12605 [Streptomyces sp. NBC_01591]